MIRKNDAKPSVQGSGATVAPPPTPYSNTCGEYFIVHVLLTSMYSINNSKLSVMHHPLMSRSSGNFSPKQSSSKVHLTS